jgi:Tol biopolymer transport system component
VNKRAIAILGAIFILIIATLGFLIYNRTKNAEPEVAVIPIVEEPNTEPPDSPAEPSGRAIRLSDEAVVSPVLFFQGNGISYFNSSGQLFQTDLQITDTSVLLSNKRELPIVLKPGISRILWPQAGNSFIAEFDAAGKKTWSYYDSARGLYVDLPGQISTIDWMPTGDKIMYVWVNNGKANLSLANPDASGFQTLTDFFVLDNIIDVSPDGKNVLFYRNQTSDSTKNAINMVSADGKNFSSAVKDGYNRGTLWSPDSKKFLFSRRDPATLKYELWVADVTTGEVRDLGFTTTEQKAVWSKDGQVIYAAVPKTGTAGEGLTQDNIYRLNVSTMDKTELDPGTAVDARDLFLSGSENILFFRNAQDNSLYYIKL